jgi:uncharacterized protein (DUF1800 family)
MIRGARDISIRLWCACMALALPAQAQLDQNANTQSDVWEMLYGAAGLSATNDPDLDGFNNRAESLAGTDPLSASSFPRVSEIGAAGGRTRQFLPSVRGKLYTLHGAGDDAAWTALTNRVGTGDSLALENTADAPHRWFRFAVSDLDTDGDGLTDWEESALGFDPGTNRTDRVEQTDFTRVAASLHAACTVAVVVLDGEISERWPDPGVVAIRRSGGLRPLTVSFAMSGTAERDVDYLMPAGTTIAIPAGVREVWLEMMPVADANDAEGTETITVTLAPGTGYVVGAASAATLQLANETAGSPPSPKAAARFLVQAAFGPDQDSTNDVDHVPENVEEVMALGFDAWIEDQFTRPVGLIQPFTEYASTSIPEFFTDPKQAAWWNRAMGVPSLIPGGPPQAPDPLRQRMAFALSQILVISDRPETLAVNPIGMANYYDMLLQHSFGNYRDLLLDVTLHPCMGFYLSHLMNRKPDPVNNIFPDENYAREIMQLFSIGLWELNQDGTRRLDTNGLPIPTYDNGDITEFARVFTGLSYGPSNAPAFLNAQQNFLVPMKMWDAHHDCDPKTLLNGVTLPARVPSAPDTGAAGMLDLQAAIDNLFWHTNVAPFIGKQLIQRFVTSNPGTGYVARVSAAFNDNGAGVRGDLKAVLRAVLLDDEARDPANLHNPSFGKMREPFLRVVNMARAFNAAASAGYYALDDFNIDHYQQPLNSPSVFNFYLPGYLPPGALAQANLLGPEFQILNAGSAISGPNYYVTAVRSGLHRWGTSFPERTVLLNLAPELALVTDVDALVRRLDLALMYGTLSSRESQIIREAVSRIHSGLWLWQQERVYLAIYLMVTSPEFCVMR